MIVPFGFLFKWAPRTLQRRPRIVLRQIRTTRPSGARDGEPMVTMHLPQLDVASPDIRKSSDPLAEEAIGSRRGFESN
ncbi:hypothetical protein C0J52_24085 [Blattella germanica]|nr:hypothetical protein C0J52_24085 [Blattella germanica]